MTHHAGSVIGFGDVTTLLRRQWRIILTAGLLGVAAGLSVALVLPPRYTAKAQFVIDPQADPEAVLVDEAAVETRVESLLTSEHRRRLLDSLSAQAAAGDPDLPDIGDLTDEEIARSLNAFKERRSRIVSLTFTSRDPRLAALVANRAVELHIDGMETLRRTSVDARLDALSRRIPAARARMELAERALQEHRVATGIVDEGLTAGDDRRIAEIQRQLAIARSSADVGPDADETPAPRSQEDGRLADGNVRLSSAAPHLGSQSLAGADALTPLMVLPVDEADPPDAPARPSADAISDARIRFLEAELAAARKAGAELLEARVAYSSLQREAAVTAELHEALVREQADLEMADPMPPHTRVVSLASPPRNPSTPNPLLFVMPSTVFALVIGAMFGFVREHSDRRIRSERDVNDMLGLNCLGLVPRLNRSGRANPRRTLLNDPESPYVEAIRSIAAALLDLPRPRAACRVVLVTSIAPGDGKSTLALSIAAYAARLNRRVLLIDLDHRKSQRPAARRMTSIGQTVAHPTADLIRTRPEEGLDRLSLSRGGLDPLVFLADDGLSATLEECRQRYDVIVIDSGRPLGTTEVRMLATMSDRILLATKWGTTRWDVAEKALSQLRLLASPDLLRRRISVVITQVNLKQQSRYRYDSVP